MSLHVQADNPWIKYNVAMLQHCTDEVYQSSVPRYMCIGTFTKSEDLDEMPHYVAFHQGFNKCHDNNNL